MPIDVKMPALSPTMEEGTLAKWLVKPGDRVAAGDLLAEIETDKATMEFEVVDEGVIEAILIAEGTEGVKVGTVIATILSEDEPRPKAAPVAAQAAPPAPRVESPTPKSAAVTAAPAPTSDDRLIASPLAKKLAEERGIDLASIQGSGPGGRIVKADVEAVGSATPAPTSPPAAAEDNSAGPAVSPLAKRLAEDLGVDLSNIQGSGPAGRIVKADIEAASVGSGAAASSASPPSPGSVAQPAATPTAEHVGIPHEVAKLSMMRKTIARRLTESKQQIPHIYLNVDIRLDALLKFRAELNDSLASRGVKLSVNDMLIKALGIALVDVPKCNVSFAGDNMLMYTRADISVAVSIPNGLITPIVVDAGSKAISTIATEMNYLSARAKEGKLQPHEYQGGTASLSNMGMMGIKQFEAVINPPQAMIMAIGAGEKRPFVVDDALAIATVMSATGSFDHRAIDGADGAQLMTRFKELIEKPLGLVA